MLRHLPVPLAALLLVVSGVFHGIHTDRWSTSAEVERTDGFQECGRCPQVSMTTPPGYPVARRVSDNRQEPMAVAFLEAFGPLPGGSLGV